MRNPKIAGIGSILILTGMLALMFVVASTGVTGNSPMIYVAILCGYYGMFAVVAGIITLCASALIWLMEKLKK